MSNQAPAVKTTSAKVDVVEHLNEARRTAEEAAARGRLTLEELNQQNEILASTEDTLEANEYVLQKSMRVLRGMTWSGWVYNAFSSEKQPDTSCANAAAEANRSFSNQGASSLSGSASSSSSKLPNKAALLGENKNKVITEAGKTGLDVVDKHLEEISNAVSEIHGMSLLMGEVLDGQKVTLDRIDRKTELVHDKTLAVTLKASQITQRTKKLRSDFLGKFQFIEVESGMYLSVDVDENLELTSIPTRSTFFNCYSKADNIVGIQNCKTLTYIGTTWVGGVKAAGRVFGKQEECHIGLKDGELTGLFVLCKNWGGGGWVKKTPATASTPAYMTSTTSSVIDKDGALVLRVILVSKDLEADDSERSYNQAPPAADERVS